MGVAFAKQMGFCENGMLDGTFQAGQPRGLAGQARPNPLGILAPVP